MKKKTLLLSLFISFFTSCVPSEFGYSISSAWVPNSFFFGFEAAWLMKSVSDFDYVFDGYEVDANVRKEYNSSFFRRNVLVLTIITTTRVDQDIEFRNVEIVDDEIVVSYGFDSLTGSFRNEREYQFIKITTKTNATSAKLDWDLLQ